MKNILIATDFSANAANAAKYGYALASQLHTNIVLLNTFLAPEATPQGNMIGWPLEDYNTLLEDSRHQIEQFKNQLEEIKPEEAFRPAIKCISEMGTLTDMLLEQATRLDIGLIILSTHHVNTLDTLITGNHCRELIDTTTRPLLVVPFDQAYRPIEKIAFASAFEHLDEDLKAIYELITFARPLNAEILLTNVYDDTRPASYHDRVMRDILSELSNKANYPGIYYRLVRQFSIEAGLGYLCGHGRISMLAMVHRPHTWLAKIITGSHTQKMAKHPKVPLMVFRPNTIGTKPVQITI
jgi:nucleotide-binding universal stress UspA family protein